MSDLVRMVLRLTTAQADYLQQQTASGQSRSAIVRRLVQEDMELNRFRPSQEGR